MRGGRQLSVLPVGDQTALQALQRNGNQLPTTIALPRHPRDPRSQLAFAANSFKASDGAVEPTLARPRLSRLCRDVAYCMPRPASKAQQISGSAQGVAQGE